MSRLTVYKIGPTECAQSGTSLVAWAVNVHNEKKNLVSRAYSRNSGQLSTLAREGTFL